MTSYDGWKLASPPEPPEAEQRCWTCAHMFELLGEWVCCYLRDKDGVDGELEVCSEELELRCMEAGDRYLEA